MANVDITNGTGGVTHPSAHAHVYQAGTVAVTVDFAKAAAKKGSPLVAGDVLYVVELPPKTRVSFGFVSLKSAVGADTTALTLDVGERIQDPDHFVDGFDAKGATVGDFGAPASTLAPIIVGRDASHIVLTLATLTGALTSGSVVVGAELLDLAAPAASVGLATRT